MATTKQVPAKKASNNPTGKGGFADHPENRSDGGWDKADSISYQYNSLMRFSPKQLATFKPETVAQEIALMRLQQARMRSGLGDAKEITDRTEGKAAQSIDLTSGGDKLSVALVQYIGNDSNDNQDPGQDTGSVQGA